MSDGKRPLDPRLAQTWQDSGLLTAADVAAVEARVHEGGTWADAAAEVVSPAVLPAVLEIGHAVADGTLVDPEPAPGDRYLETAELGEGGMGRVIAAHDRRLGRRVALKHCKRLDPASVKRFLREARIMAQLEHPGIVQVHDIGVSEDGRPYYTMRRVRGTTMQAALDGAKSPAERLALLGVLVAACHAVAYAHARGVVHRDLKPENVMVGPFGDTLVIDWGLARVGDSGADESSGVLDPGTSTRTVAGALVGTVAYMSPEQARGERATAQSDVWSLGIMLWTLLAGHNPFAGLAVGSILEELRKNRKIPAPAGAPPELAAITARALQTHAALRYADAGALARDIEAFRNGGLVGAFQYTPGDLIRRWLFQRRGLVAMGGVVAAVVLAIGAVAIYGVVAERDRALIAEAATADSLHRARIEGLRAAADRGIAKGDTASALALLGGALVLDDHPSTRARADLQHALTEPAARWMAPEGGSVVTLAASSDGRAAVVASDRVVAFDPTTGEVWPLEEVGGGTLLQAVLPDSAHLVGVYASRNADSEVVAHTLPSGEVSWRARLAGHRPLDDTTRTTAETLSASGDRIAWKDRDWTIHQVELPSGRELPRLDKNGMKATWLRYLRDDVLAIVIGGDSSQSGLLQYVDPSTGDITLSEVLEPPPYALASSQDALALVMAKTLRVESPGGPSWSVPFLTTLRAVAVSPDGHVAAIIGGDGHARAWRDGQPLALDIDHAGPIRISDDGRWLLVGTGADAVRLIDLSGDADEQELTGSPDGIAQLVATHDRLIAGTVAGRTLVWPIDATRATRAWRSTRVPGTGPFFRLVVRGPDVASLGFWAKRVALGEPGGVGLVAEIGDPSRLACDARWSGDELIVLAAAPCATGVLGPADSNPMAPRIYGVGKNGQVEQLGAIEEEIIDGHMALSPDGSRVATVGRTGCAGIWSSRATANAPDLELCGLEEAGALAWSEDGRQLVVAPATTPGDLAWWDASSGTERARAPVTHRVDAVVVGSTGHVAAVSNEDGRMTLYSGAAAPSEADLRASIRSSPVFSTDGHHLAAGLETGRIAIVDLADDGPTRIVTHPLGSDAVWSVAWSPDGTRIVGGTASGRVVVLETSEGWPLADGRVGDEPVLSVAWSQAGDRVFALGREGTSIVIPSQPLLERETLIERAAAATNLRPCIEPIGETLVITPWTDLPDLTPIDCKAAARPPRPVVR